MNRDDRVNVGIRINLKYPDRDTFVERFSQNISRTGVFVRASDPLPVGSLVDFDYRLSDGTVVLEGTGAVRWVRSVEAAREPHAPPGMGLEFTELEGPSAALVREIVERFGEGERASSGAAPQRQKQATLDDARLTDLTAAVEALAQSVAGEPLDRAVMRGAVPAASVRVGTPSGPLIVDLAGGDVAIASGNSRVRLVPGLALAQGRPRIDPAGTPVPRLVAWLAQTFPAVLPAAVASRLGVGLGRAPDGGLVLLLQKTPVSIRVAVAALLRAVLAAVAGRDTGAVLAIVPSTLSAAGLATLQTLFEDAGLAQVRCLPAALALGKAHTGLALVVQVGMLGCELALVDGRRLLAASFAPDLGFFDADSSTGEKIARLLLKEGVDVDDDQTLGADLLGAVREARRTKSWRITLAGSTVAVDERQVAGWLQAQTERLVLMCDRVMRQEAPHGQRVKKIVVACDEAPWPGLQAAMGEQLGSTPDFLPEGIWSRVTGALSHGHGATAPLPSADETSE